MVKVEIYNSWTFPKTKKSPTFMVVLHHALDVGHLPISGGFS